MPKSLKPVPHNLNDKFKENDQTEKLLLYL